MSDIDRRQDVRPIVARIRRERVWTAVVIIGLSIVALVAIFIAGELGYSP